MSGVGNVVLTSLFVVMVLAVFGYVSAGAISAAARNYVLSPPVRERTLDITGLSVDQSSKAVSAFRVPKWSLSPTRGLVLIWLEAQSVSVFRFEGFGKTTSLTEVELFDLVHVAPRRNFKTHPSHYVVELGFRSNSNKLTNTFWVGREDLEILKAYQESQKLR